MKFENPSPVSDYHIYYVYDDTAEALIINPKFINERNYCPTICDLTGADNFQSEHEAIQLFDTAHGNLVISSANRSLIGTSLSLRISC